MRDAELAVVISDLSKTYANGSVVVHALSQVNLLVPRGESVAITGPSGSGKTTLLHLISGLDRVTSGEIFVFGEGISRRSDNELASFRAKRIGLVFQEAYLLPGLTAVENVVVAGLPWRSRRVLEPEARELLDAVGLSNRVSFTPGRLSTGERQRVAIARALAGSRELLLADEPTGNLDAETTDEIIDLLQGLVRDQRLTLIVATHDAAVAAAADRLVRLRDGRIENDETLDGLAKLEIHEVIERS